MEGFRLGIAGPGNPGGFLAGKESGHVNFGYKLWTQQG